MTKISVITPVRNGERFIRQTVESVLSQKGKFDLEYIIRDACSTDRTLDVLAEYKGRLTVISEPDGSPQQAINAGMASATGEIGCWLNADDMFEPGALQAVSDAFSNNPDKLWLYGRCRIIDENNIEIRRPITWYKILIGLFYSHNVLLCENYINQPATFWRMSLWRKCNNLDPRYKAAWDYELWLNMAQHSPAIHLRKYLSRFRRHENSISETNFLKQFAEELDATAKYGNRLHWAIHKFNYYKITATYRLLQKKKMYF